MSLEYLLIDNFRKKIYTIFMKNIKKISKKIFTFLFFYKIFLKIFLDLMSLRRVIPFLWAKGHFALATKIFKKFPNVYIFIIFFIKKIIKPQNWEFRPQLPIIIIIIIIIIEHLISGLQKLLSITSNDSPFF